MAKTNLGEKIKAFIDDVATLDVVTLTGDISVELKKIKFDDLDNLTEEVITALKASKDNVRYMAFSHYEFDCDSVSYFNENCPETLLKAHSDTAASALDARRSMVKLVVENFSNLLGI
jgi:hypothetical protein